jgi:hypothetical protein
MNLQRDHITRSLPRSLSNTSISCAIQYDNQHTSPNGIVTYMLTRISKPFFAPLLGPDDFFRKSHMITCFAEILRKQPLDQSTFLETSQPICRTRSPLILLKAKQARRSLRKPCHALVRPRIPYGSTLICAGNVLMSGVLCRCSSE